MIGPDDLHQGLDEFRGHSDTDWIAHCSMWPMSYKIILSDMERTPPFLPNYHFKNITKTTKLTCYECYLHTHILYM